MKYNKFFKGWSKDVLQSCPCCGAEMSELVDTNGHWYFECDTCDLTTNTGSRLEVTLADVLWEAYEDALKELEKLRSEAVK